MIATSARPGTVYTLTSQGLMPLNTSPLPLRRYHAPTLEERPAMHCQRTHPDDHCVMVCSRQATVYLMDADDWGVCVCAQCAADLLAEHPDWTTHPLTGD